MKKYLFHLFYGILAFMIASCTNSEMPQMPNVESFDDSDVSISIDDARNELNQLLLDQENAYSRSVTNPKRVITTKGAPFSDEYSSGITGSIHYPNCSFDFNYVLNAVIGIRK